METNPNHPWSLACRWDGFQRLAGAMSVEKKYVGTKTGKNGGGSHAAPTHGTGG